MKIVFVTGNYLPGKNGGIENYTHGLATMLRQHHFDVDVAALNVNETGDYIFEGIKINNLKGSFASFEKILKNGAYDICHFQEYSAFGGIEMFWIKAARQYCKRIFFTFHLPYFTCYKNDFRYFGIEDCNNFSSPGRCVKCVVATRLHYTKSAGFNMLNAGIKLVMPLLLKSNKPKGLRQNIRLNTDNLTRLIESCDKVFVIANWFKDLLLYNNYDSQKINLLPPVMKAEGISAQNDNSIKKKLLFAGRIEKQKGLHVLCEAMNSVTVKDIQIDVFGNVVDEIYFRKCEKEYAFNFKGTTPRRELLLKMPAYDFLVLPSVFTEMYSMILQEALNAHLPVIVSAAKGNVGVIKDGKNGFIFKYDDHNDLATVIDKAYSLLRSGWQPQFTTPCNFGNSLREILSYY